MTTNKPVSAMGHSTRRVVRELRNKILRGELAPGAALRCGRKTSRGSLG